jgi:hypothetical protein
MKNIHSTQLTSVEKDFYQMVMPRLVASATSGFDSSSIFFTDGSKGGRVLVLVLSILVVPSPSFVFRETSRMFTSEMSAIFVALFQILLGLAAKVDTLS